MKATFSWLFVLLCAGVMIGGTPQPAQAQYPYPYPCYPCVPQAPDACGPGFFAYNHCGALYGPNYCLRPCFPPFQGFQSCQRPSQQKTPAFPTHPFARSPRDFFMLD